MKAFDQIVREASEDWQYTDDVGEGSGAPGVVGVDGEIIAICDFWFGEKRQPTRAQAEANARLAALGAKHVAALVRAAEDDRHAPLAEARCRVCQALAAVEDAAEAMLAAWEDSGEVGT